MTKSTFRFIIGLAAALCMTQTNAQVGIGTTSPKGALDITSSTNGLLIPRISIPNVDNTGSGIVSPTTSVLVYNTNASITGGNGEGFYYWDGTEWVRLETRPSSDWTLIGNDGTNANVNFVGTKDNVDLVLRTNNTERVRFDTDGRILATQTTLGTIGTSPSYTWNGDVDSGLRRNGSDDISLMAGDTGMVHLVETGSGNAVTIEPGTSVDTDFSVNSQTETGFLFADASTNRVGIGTTNPTNALHVIHNEDGGGVIRIQNNTAGGFAGAYFFQGNDYKGHVGYVNTGGTSGFADKGTFQVAAGNRNFVISTNDTDELFSESVEITTDKKLLIYENSGLLNPDYWETYVDAADDYNFGFNGTLEAYIEDGTGAYQQNSDRRLKENIKPMQNNVLDKLLSLNPVTYTYIKDKNKKKQNGFIAQEVKPVFPELLSYKNGFYGLNYTSFGVLAVKAIQEQQDIIDSQNKRITTLENEIQEIKRLLKK